MFRMPRFLSLVFFLSASGAAHAVAVSGQGTWEVDLEPRLVQLDGTAAAYYDKALDVTWLANANPAIGAPHEAQGANILPGEMYYSDAVAWVIELNVGGVTNWRLPNLTVRNATFSVSGTDYGWNVSTEDSELAHMFYVTLGNSARFDTGGLRGMYGLSNTANFLNLQANSYWTGTRYSSNLDFSWEFATSDGSQAVSQYPGFIWAVHSGDVAAVPEPDSAVLTMSGLGAIAWSVRRRRSRIVRSSTSRNQPSIPV